MSFRETLRADPPQASTDQTTYREALRAATQGLERATHTIDQAYSAAKRGQSLSPEALLLLQGAVYRYSQEVELASKLVDKAASSVRTTLQSQQ